jgi:hypothetical protein
MIGKKGQSEPRTDDDERLTEELKETFPASDPPSLTEPGKGVSGDPAADERLHKIRERAHAIWVEEGRPHGGHDDHWRRAEMELRREAGPSAKRSKS